MRRNSTTATLQVLGAGLRHRERRGDALVLLGGGAPRASASRRARARPSPRATGRRRRARRRRTGGAGGDDAALQLPDEVAAAVVAAGELLARRLARRELQVERLGARRPRAPRAAPRRARRPAASTVRKASRASDASTCSNSARSPAARRPAPAPARRRAAARAAVARYWARRSVSGAHEGGQRLRRHIHRALQAREAQLALLDVALAQAGAVGADDQQARPLLTPRRAASAGASSGTEYTPARRAPDSSSASSQGASCWVLVNEASSSVSLRRSASAPAERKGRGKTRVAVALGEAPLHHRVAVGAAQERTCSSWKSSPATSASSENSAPRRRAGIRGTRSPRGRRRRTCLELEAEPAARVEVVLSPR